jgi:hypothetical protein
MLAKVGQDCSSVWSHVKLRGAARLMLKARLASFSFAIHEIGIENERIK